MKDETPASPLRPFWMAVLVYLGVTAWLAHAALEATGGVFTYPLDDTYIHMAVARSLAESGTWGLRPGEFAGVSSSPLWTLMLAGWFRVAGVREAAPLALNLLAGTGVLWLGHRLLSRAGWCGEHALWWLTGLALVIPLPTLAMAGMEHTLQIALSLWLLDAASAQRPRSTVMAAAAAAVVACRYEGLFVVGAVAAWCAWHGRMRPAIGIVLAGLLPVIAYAFFAGSQGGLWLPNSVLVKAGAPDNMSGLSAWAGRTASRLWAALGRLPEIALACSAVSVAVSSPRSGSGRLLTTVFVIVLVAHGLFVPLRVLYRYEAVVVALGVLACAVLVAGLPRRGRVGVLMTGVLLAVAGGTSALRAVEAIARTPDASRNVYEQQRQMAIFLDGMGAQAVALNDIGAVSFFSQARIVDLAGLATTEVARLRMRSELDTGSIERIARERGAVAAVLYPAYFTGATALPSSWTEVERWRIQNRVSAAYDTVAFYAVTPAGVDDLVSKLARFRPFLPAGVTVSR